MSRELLSGEFDHTLDPKGRVTLPARYREYFRHGAVLVRFPEGDPCVCVYHPDAWSDYDARYLDPLDMDDEEHSWRVRDIYRNRIVEEPDGQGRVLIPTPSIKELGLAGKVKILGNRTHLEIWNPATLTELEAARSRTRSARSRPDKAERDQQEKKERGEKERRSDA